MPTISWNENAPAGGDTVALGPNEIKSLKTALRTAIDSEHVFPSSGGDAGVHRLGSGRPFYGTQSAVSSSGTDGKLMMTSDTSRLFGVGSGGTVFLGGAGVISMASFPGGAAPQRYHWVEEAGTVNTTGGSTGLVSFADAYNGVPYIFTSLVTNETTSGRAYPHWVDTVSSTNFRVQARAIIGGNDPTAVGLVVTINWRSLGTRSL